MDVETVKRVNELAKQMINRGLVASSQEAYALAEKAIRTELPKIKSVKTDEKYEIFMERMQRKVSNEVGALKEQLNSILNQLNIIKQEVNNIKKNKIIKKPVEEQKVLKEEPKKEKVQKKQIKEEKEENNQRTGKFKPGDIDINKIFYFGNK